MTDTERLDVLERALLSERVGNGLALAPCYEVRDGRITLYLQDLGDQDGSDLGVDIVSGSSLRDAIDRLAGWMEEQQ